MTRSQSYPTRARDITPSVKRQNPKHIVATLTQAIQAASTSRQLIE